MPKAASAASSPLRRRTSSPGAEQLATPATARKQQHPGKENVPPQNVNVGPAIKKKRSKLPFGSRRRTTKADKEAAKQERDEQKLLNIQAANKLKIRPGVEILLVDDESAGVWRVVAFVKQSGKYELSTTDKDQADIGAEVLEQRFSDGSARLLDQSLPTILIELRARVEMKNCLECDQIPMPRVPDGFEHGHISSNVFTFTPKRMSFREIWKGLLSAMEGSRPRDSRLGANGFPITEARIPLSTDVKFSFSPVFDLELPADANSGSKQLEPLAGAASFMQQYMECCRRKASKCVLEWTHVWRIHRYRHCVCFGGDGFVRLAGSSSKRVRELRSGDLVQVERSEGGAGVAEVLGIWRTAEFGVRDMVRLDGVLLTPDHPVLSEAGEWVRPDTLASPSPRFVDYLYNVALSSFSGLPIAASPSLRSSQVQCCTLGQAVPGFDEPLWGSKAILKHMQAQPDWPHVGGHESELPRSSESLSLAVAVH